MSTTAKTGSFSAPSEVKDFINMMKPRVMSLVIFTAIAGYLVAPGALHPFLAFTTLLCISIGAGASAVLNNWYDKDIDAVMTRTQRRALPQGRVVPAEALSFGIFLSFFSVVVLSLAVNLLAGGILALTIAFYFFVYTMGLKRRTPQNIVIGGAAGAFPPMISWAAVTGSLDVMPILMFLIIFLWTPPHFWALALYKSGDYAKAGVPMMPVVKGDKSTKWQMLFYTLLLIPVTIMPAFMDGFRPIYLGLALILNVIFTLFNVKLIKDEENKIAPKMFFYSIFYLFALFMLLIIDRMELSDVAL